MQKQKMLLAAALAAAFACSASAQRVPLDSSGYWNVLLHLGANYNTDRLSYTSTSTAEFKADQLSEFGGQANQKPYPGAVYNLQSKDFVWTVITNTAGDSLWKTSPDINNFVKYWHIYIYSPDSANRAARLVYRNDDDIGVWRNGVSVLSQEGWDSNNERTKDFDLLPGQNSFTIKLREGTSGDVMRIKLTDNSGVPFNDLTYGFYPGLESIPAPGIAQITENSVALEPGFANRTGADVALYALCSTNDWGESLADWQAHGAVVSGVFGEIPASILVGGLDGTTRYFARICAESYGEEVWSGASEFTTYGSLPVIASKPVESLTGSRAELPAELFYACGLSAADITIYWGPDDGETDAAAWTNSVQLGSQDIGVVPFTLTGLVPYETYYYRHKAEVAGGVFGWAPETMSFTAPGAPALGATSADPKLSSRQIIFSSELLDIGGAPVTVDLFFGDDPDNMESVNAWADLAQAQALSHAHGNVTANAEYYYAFRAVNEMENGREFEVWTATNSITFGMGKIWTGAGDGTSWDDAANWDGGIPSAADTAIFTDAGLSAGKTISLNASQTIYSLQIDAALSFTIGSAADKTAAYSLALSALSTPATGGATYTFGAQLAAALTTVPGTSVWHVASGILRITGGTATGADVSLMKTGAGKIELNSGTLHTGTTIVAEGPVTAQGSPLRGNLIVGTPDGTAAASYSTTSGGAGVPENKNVTVYPNGYFFIGDYPGINNLYIYGGSVNGNWPNINSITMRGGLLSGGPLQGDGRNIITLANDTSAVISGDKRLSAYGNGNFIYNIADGAAPIDLLNSGPIRNESSSYFVEKTGLGVMQITNNGNSFNKLRFDIKAGAVLVDNTANSGIPNALINISAGATLGGVGSIGGVDTAPDTRISATGNATTPATIAPGTIDATTGEHIIGALTVGSAAQTNNVTFGDHSRLAVSIGAASDNDQLDVFGAATISATGTILDIAIAPDARDDTYTLLRASNGVNGEFASVMANGKPPVKPNKIRYTNTEVQYIILSETLILIR